MRISDWSSDVCSSDLPVPTPALGALAALRTLAFGGRETISAVARELRSSFTDFREKNPDLVVGGQAPRCLFNQKVSATRRISATSYSTPRMKEEIGRPT